MSPDASDRKRRAPPPAGVDERRLAEAMELSEHAPIPAVVGRIRCGTAGWTDKSLIQSKTFYPPGASSPEARLRHYARHFDLVELDATYYTLLSPEVVSKWLEWTPPSFVFDVKAHPVLTGHPIDVRRLPADLRQAVEATGATGTRVYGERLPVELEQEIENRFFASIEPLVAAGRLGCVMLQFPPWVRANRGSARKIERIRERWQAVPLAVEFRNKTWLLPERRDRVLDWLRGIQASYVIVDEPDVPTGGVPTVFAVTRPELAIVRFHGHNIAGWQRGTSVAQRFDYLYTPAEIGAWAAPIRRLSATANDVHAVFNNCVRNYAVLNAKGLAVLLEGAESAPEATGEGR